jgi:hypothetical protein
MFQALNDLTSYEENKTGNAPGYIPTGTVHGEIIFFKCTSYERRKFYTSKLWLTYFPQSRLWACTVAQRWHVVCIYLSRAHEIQVPRSHEVINWCAWVTISTTYIVSRAHDLIPRGHDLVTFGHDIAHISRAHKINRNGQMPPLCHRRLD